MKSMVVYSSQTGNTEKAAKAVLASMPAGAEIYPMDQAPDPSGYELVAVGFWFQGGGPDPKTAAFLPQLAGRQVILFATHGAPVGSPHVETGLAKAAKMTAGADVLGSISCLGEVNPKVLEKVSARPDPPPWIGDAPKANGHPDQADLDRLGKDAAAVVAKAG